MRSQFAIAFLVFAACSKSTTETDSVPALASVIVSSATGASGSMTLAAGQSVQLVATTKDQFGSPISTIIAWTSATSAIARVNVSGLLTAVSSGTTNVFANATAANGKSVSGAISVMVPVSPAGVWLGTVGTQSLSLTLAETSGKITGTGTLTRSTGNLALIVNGEWTVPSLSLNMSVAAGAPITLQATMTIATAMTGPLNGAGFTGEVITLTRQ